MIVNILFNIRNSSSLFWGYFIMAIVGIIIAIIGIFVSVFPNPIRDYVIERLGIQLSVKPKRKDIHCSTDGNNWNEEFYIYLTNNTSNTYYDINVVSEYPNSIEVNIFPEDNNEFSALESTQGQVFVGSGFVLCGEIKEHKTKIVQSVINNIGPNEKKKLKVIVNKKDDNKNCCLEFKVGGFNKNPKPLLSR